MNDRKPTDDFEVAKLAFEQKKLDLEIHWKKRTFQWSIASALLTAIILIAVGFFANSGSSFNISTGPVESCRESLQRLTTLANINGQTVSNLASAIARHERECNEVLIDILTEIGK